MAALEDGDNNIPMGLRHALAGLLARIVGCQEAMTAIGWPTSPNAIAAASA